MTEYEMTQVETRRVNETELNEMTKTNLAELDEGDVQACGLVYHDLSIF